jgi:Uma2 family endonuclease
MGETTLHRMVIVDLIHGLTTRFRNDPETWVGGDLFLYYRTGEPRYVVCPDVLLVRGVRKWNRPVFFLWEERPPSLIVEVTSPGTRKEDTVQKKGLYEQLGVEEYILFDPYGEYLKPPLQGFRLTRSGYEPIPLEPDGSLRSRTTGLILRREREQDGERLRLVDPATGERLRWPEESESSARESEERIVERDERIAALEAEIVRLRAERS